MEQSILIVSGQTSVRMNLQKSLQATKHSILTAASGKAAIEIDKNSMSNLIIADTSIPDMPVEEMLLSVREYRRLMKDVVENEYVPVLLIAAINEKVDETKLKNLGVLAKLNKPLNLKLIHAVVTKVLSGELKLEKEKLVNIFILDPEKRALGYFSKMLHADDVNIHTMGDVFDLYSSINGSVNADILIVEIMVHDKPIEFVKELRTKYPKANVLVCTAMHDEELHKKCRQLGVKDVLTKPVNPAKMRSTVREIVAKVNV